MKLVGFSASESESTMMLCWENQTESKIINTKAEKFHLWHLLSN